MENLLDNLESELTEMVELDLPEVKKRPRNDESQKIKTSQNSQKKSSPPPVPARRNISKSPLHPPTPASRRISSLDKIEKNNENEIIQLQSLNSETESFSSESKKISQNSSKHNTVISINEKKKKEPTNSIRVFHEAEKMPDDINETFFVIKHGKWAEENSNSTEQPEFINQDEEKDIEESQSVTNLSQKSDEIPKLDKKTKKRQEKKKKNLKKQKDSLTTSITTSFTSSSSESLSEEIPQPQKKTKNHKSKNNIGKKKSKKLGEDQTPTSNTEESRKETKRIEITSCDKAIGKLIMIST